MKNTDVDYDACALRETTTQLTHKESACWLNVLEGWGCLAIGVKWCRNSESTSISSVPLAFTCWFHSDLFSLHGCVTSMAIAASPFRCNKSSKDFWSLRQLLRASPVRLDQPAKSHVCPCSSWWCKVRHGCRKMNGHQGQCQPRVYSVDTRTHGDVMYDEGCSSRSSISNVGLPWLLWLSGLSAGLWTKVSLVWLPV